MLPELNRYKDTIRCDRLGAKVPGHRQQQLMQTLIVRLSNTHFFGDLFFVVSKIAQPKTTKLHRWQYLGQVLDDEVTVGDLFTVQLHERQEPPLAPQLAIVVDVLEKKDTK